MTQRVGTNRIANTAVSGLKLADNSIRGNNIVAGTITGNLISSNTITGNSIAMGAIEQYQSTTGYSPFFRNRIINGDMRIDQRKGGGAQTINSTANTFTVDRFYGTGQSTDGVFTVQRHPDAPAGFANSAKITVTTADASIGATQSYYFGQAIEGNNIADLNWGSANAKNIAVSFYVKSNVTGNFSSVIRNIDGTRCYPSTFTVNSSNTWEYKTVTISGNTSGTWATSNNTGILFLISLGAGSSVTGTSNAWTSSSVFGVTGQANLISTLNGTMYITGVQLEPGNTSTSFERRTYGLEIDMCSRYYQKSYPIDMAVGTVTRAGTVNWNWGAMTSYGTATIAFPIRMRSSPTMVNFDPDSTNTVGGRYWNGSAEVQWTGSLSGFVGNDVSGSMNADGTSRSNMLFNWLADAEIT